MSGSEDELFEKADAGDSGYWIKKMQAQRERTCFIIKPDDV